VPRLDLGVETGEPETARDEEERGGTAPDPFRALNDKRSLEPPAGISRIRASLR
jgi:hypothetical protein